MKNIDFLKKYQKLQHKIMFDELIELNGSRLGTSNLDKTAFWNFSLADRNINEKELLEIEEKMELFDRVPVVYLENSGEFLETVQLLKSKNYKKIYEDSWMFWNENEISDERFFQIKKVENSDDLKIYLKTLDDCFGNDDPQNPYGELGDYLKVAEKVWFEFHDSDRLEYFIAYKNDEAVAVAALSNFEGIGYISNVGSLKKVRGEGFGRLVTLYCVEISKKRGNNLHFLATEENTYPNEFYKQIGFKTKFTGIAYAKN